MALPHPQINKDNGCRQMDSEFLPLLQNEHLGTYIYCEISHSDFLIMKGLILLISLSIPWNASPCFNDKEQVGKFFKNMSSIHSTCSVNKSTSLFKTPLVVTYPFC